MPIYEYKCQSCDRRIERIQRFSDDPLTECEHCQGRLEKVFSPSALVFKGSGWYVTDYAKKDKNKDGKSDKVQSQKNPPGKDKSPEEKTSQTNPSQKSPEEKSTKSPKPQPKSNQ